MKSTEIQRSLKTPWKVQKLKGVLKHHEKYRNSRESYFTFINVSPMIFRLSSGLEVVLSALVFLFRDVGLFLSMGTDVVPV